MSTGEKAPKRDGALHAGHRSRMRERFLKDGLEGMADHEAVELLTYFAVPRVDTNELAHRLCDSCDSFHALFDLSYEDLRQIPGVSENLAVLIKLMPALARRYMQSRQEKVAVLNSTKSTCDYMKPRFLGRTEEVVVLACLDAQYNVRYCREIFQGSVNSAEISVRRIAELAIRSNAVFVVLAHNHPGGLPLPSREDINTTQQVASGLRPLGITLVDHIIVAGNDTLSLANDGYMDLSF